MANSYTGTSVPVSPNAISASKPELPPDVTGHLAATEVSFLAALTVERRRAERSRKSFVLMLLDAHLENGSAQTTLLKAMTVLASSIRETDMLGWYRDGAVLGIIFTELGSIPSNQTAEILRNKVRAALQAQLGAEITAKILITLHVFPQEWNRNDKTWVADTALYPEFRSKMPAKNASRAIKRAMDIVGSASLLVLLSPVLAAIALAIKLTSKGPVFFGQERMGRFGARFRCWKFRSMYVNNAPTIHQDYVKQFIAGKETEKNSDAGEVAPVYKITNDPRVTPIGRILRRTSLDELPQFWNVLIGDMSLVGPRPPVPYEFEIYDFWHRRRVLEVQPGITGLWQVNGRSRTRFDEMVRLDVRYCTTWSLWLDIKILLATPKAVLFGSGAY
jgi:exopolysaccharide biosynthesis polyprenyl glycosylphosphotransferase